MRRFALGAIVLVAACSLPSVGLWSGEGKADTGLYSLYGSKIVHGHMPYRSGFSLEFPPGALPALAVPALPRSHYAAWFHVFQLACGLAALAAVVYAGGSTFAVLATAVAPALLGQISLNALDWWSAALGVWAVALVVRERPRLGFVVLAAATAAKLYPILLAPVLLAYVVPRERARAALTGVVALALIFAPFVVAAPGGVRYSLQEQVTRGLQVESLGGALLGGAHRLGAGFHVVVSHAPFSFNVGGKAADWVAALSSLLVLAGVAAAWWLLRRGVVTRRRALTGAAATAIAFVAFAKVLSPQYLLFAVPLVPLAESTLASGVFLLALGLTQVWVRFPEPFLRTVHFGPLIWVVLVRDLVLVGLYALLLARLRVTSTPKSPTTTRSRTTTHQVRA